MKKILKNVTSVVAIATVFTASLYAAEKKGDKPKEVVPPKRVVDLKTKYTRNCVSLAAKKPPEKRPFKSTPEGVYKRLNKAMELMGAEDYNGSLEIMKGLYERNQDRSYVKALVALNLGKLYINMNQDAQAMRYFQIALDEASLQIPQEQGARLNLASYQYGEGNYDAALKLVKQWFKFETNPKDTGYVLLAGIYMQQGKMKDSICPSYLAIENSKKYNKNIFSLLLNAHNELKDKKGTIKVAKAMLEIWQDDPSNWRSLSTLYSIDEQFDNALAVMDLMYRQNFFEKKDDYLMLSSFFAMADIPKKAADVLKDGIEKGLVKSEEKRWVVVGQNYHAANELKKAVDAYEKASETADHGDHYAKQGQLYAFLEQWNSAVKAYDRALEKGNLKDKGKVIYDKAFALYYADRFTDAIKALEQAKGYKKQRAKAQRWISYIESRIRTLEELAAN
ncbi:MAG: hypothetical protein V2I33_02550 [Kangiellaceae bacterium]|jgi:tetratricopeptide (TPR) repeat protein|nr:hypothetical protein [Kangiellaceae bacterium]